MYKIIGADGREYGPISLEELRQWHTQGRAKAQTRVLVTGEANWKTIADLPEFSTPPAPSVAPEPIRPLTTGPTSSGFGPRTNGFAIAGLILGIFAFVISFCCCGGIPFNLAGLTCSIVGLMQINKQPDVYSGKGAAIAGIIVSGLSLLVGIGMTLLGVALNWHEIVREFQNT